MARLAQARQIRPGRGELDLTDYLGYETLRVSKTLGVFEFIDDSSGMLEYRDHRC
jgi:hypothetical protein